ncbi:MAG: hypothetical protein U5M23_07290 [Marinagarivorans sp.]|nr:hypothetical protein [Marinagarivorans sp.]
MKKILIAVILASFANICVAEIAVIVHPSNASAVSEDDVSRLF